jgi:hypothetical protein
MNSTKPEKREGRGEEREGGRCDCGEMGGREEGEGGREKAESSLKPTETRRADCITSREQGGWQ